MILLRPFRPCPFAQSGHSDAFHDTFLSAAVPWFNRFLCAFLCPFCVLRVVSSFSHFHLNVVNRGHDCRPKLENECREYL